VHRRHESGGDALTASSTSPGTDGESDSRDTINEVKSWLDGLLWRLLPSGSDEDEFATLIRREVRDSISVLATQLGFPG
jgi:hypothetical protein